MLSSSSCSVSSSQKSEGKKKTKYFAGHPPIHSHSLLCFSGLILRRPPTNGNINSKYSGVLTTLIPTTSSEAATAQGQSSTSSPDTSRKPENGCCSSSAQVHTELRKHKARYRLYPAKQPPEPPDGFKNTGWFVQGSGKDTSKRSAAPPAV